MNLVLVSGTTSKDSDAKNFNKLAAIVKKIDRSNLDHAEYEWLKTILLFRSGRQILVTSVN